MVFLGAKESGDRGDFGDDGFAEAGLRFLFRGARGGLLGGRVIENRGTILRANIRPLTVKSGGVVQAPKRVEELVIAHARRVERHLNGLCVAGAVGADIAVSWVLERPTGITHLRVRYARNFAECRLNPPKTACRKRCLVHGTLPGPLIRLVASRLFA